MVAFIRKHIDSVEQLEILLLLHAHPDRSWLPQEVSKELRSSCTSTAKRLQEFVHKNIIAGSENSEIRYIYDPKAEENQTAIAALAGAYHTKRLTVIEEIFSQPSDKIKVLADAFKLRQDD